MVWLQEPRWTNNDKEGILPLFFFLFFVFHLNTFRFRSARDTADALAELAAKGLPPPKDKPFDSNCITPGTEFMHTLSAHLQFFIRKKISEDSRWKRIKVVSIVCSYLSVSEENFFYQERYFQAMTYQEKESTKSWSTSDTWKLSLIGTLTSLTAFTDSMPI